MESLELIDKNIYQVAPFIKKKIQKINKDKKADEQKRKQEKEEKLKYCQWKRKNLRDSQLLSKEFFGWVKRFVECDLARELFTSVENKLSIFTANYHDFKPTSRKSAVGQIWIDYLGNVFYREIEWGIGRGGANRELLLGSPQQFAETLDPRYVKELFNSIRYGLVWNEIKKCVQRSDSYFPYS